ncbi:YncE family protein [Subtercola vilae]|uniref:YncE family protein n=1 Tax=Subtercola vilae TaxID=2056433 RepID=A0A4T2BCQ3_9MICO|nr:YncE family protein [Subtercola vilae]TIH27962.1 YncE family protein [Subtercola vilae]
MMYLWKKSRGRVAGVRAVPVPVWVPVSRLGMVCAVLAVAGLVVGIPSVTGVGAAGAVAAPGDATTIALGGIPSALAVDPVSHEVYATDQSSNVVRRFDGRTPGGPVSTIAVGDGPMAIAIDAGAREVFVADTALGTVSVFSADVAAPTAQLIASIPSPSAIAIDPETHVVYVTSSTGNTVNAFDGTAVSPVLTTVAVGSMPEGVTIDSETHEVFVANSADNTVSRFRGATTELRGGAAAVDLSTMSTIAVGDGPMGVAIDESNKAVFVTDLRAGWVSKFDGAAAAPTVTNLIVGRGPSGIVVDQTSHSAFASNSLDVSVSQFDTTSEIPPVLTLPTGKAPKGIGVDESTGTVFTANRLGASVSSLRPGVPVAAAITSAAPLAATIGVPYSYTVTTSGNPVPTVFFGGTAPAGLTWNAATQTLAGTPTVVGDSTISIEAKNFASTSVALTYPFVVNPPAPALAASGTLPNATVGTAYRYEILAAGSSPATCAVTSGRLPAGLSLGAATCLITGTATAAGSVDFFVTATGAGGAASGNYSIVVTPSGTGGGCTASGESGAGSGSGAGFGGSTDRPKC